MQSLPDTCSVSVYIWAPSILTYVGLDRFSFQFFLFQSSFFACVFFCPSGFLWNPMKGCLRLLGFDACLLYKLPLLLAGGSDAREEVEIPESL